MENQIEDVTTRAEMERILDYDQGRIIREVETFAIPYLKRIRAPDDGV